MVFSSREPNCSFANLDIDNTMGGDEGQETITVVEGSDKIYTLFVEDYSYNPSFPLPESQATITIFR